MAAKAKKTSAVTTKKSIKTVTPPAPVWKPAKAVVPTVLKPAVVKAAAAPAAVKPAVTPAAPVVKAPASPVAPVVRPAVVPTPSAAKAVSAAERQKMVEVAAYVLAEKNNFRGDAKTFWLQAEQEVDAKLGRK